MNPFESVMFGTDGTPRGGNPYQNNAQWLAERTGELTASRVATMLERKKDGSPTKACETLVKELLAERMTGDAIRHYVTPEMQRGLDKQGDAQLAYEVRTGNIVKHCGYVRHPTIEFLGCSPDGLVDDDGLWEGKAPNTTTHLGYMMAGVAPEEYRPQMLLQMGVTGRKWCDFSSFDDRIKDPDPDVQERRRLFVVRFEPKQTEIDDVLAEAEKFLRIVDNLMQQL